MQEYFTFSPDYQDIHLGSVALLEEKEVVLARGGAGLTSFQMDDLIESVDRELLTMGKVAEKFIKAIDNFTIVFDELARPLKGLVELLSPNETYVSDAPLGESQIGPPELARALNSRARVRAARSSITPRAPRAALESRPLRPREVHPRYPRG